MNTAGRFQNNSPTAGLIRWALAVGASLAGVALSLGWLAAQVEISSPVAAIGGSESSGGQSQFPTPDFRLATLNEGLISPLDYPGQVVAIEFWASWCGPCRLQAKFFEELNDELGGPAPNGVQFLAINTGEDTTTVEKFVANNPFSYPVLLDTDGSIAARYRVSALPTVMIVDPNGEITFLGPGVADPAKVKREIARARAAATASPTTVAAR